MHLEMLSTRAERCYCIERSLKGNVALFLTLKWAFIREVKLSVYDPVIIAEYNDTMECPNNVVTKEPHFHAIYQLQGILLEDITSEYTS